MDEVISGLWIGDLRSALDVEKLKQNGIFSILSAMRGRLTINETFIRHQILLDDTEDADILSHLLPAIHFIQAELNKGRGVLVHCQAGVSRSATIVAAYLMYSRNMDPDTALDLIRTKRPGIEPNDGFLQQLDIFHKAHYKISRKDKDVRMFYLDRTVDEVMNGDGSFPDTDMFAKFPRTPSDSVPSTPGGPRRRIRCKMCRQELAAREHMLDHGQLGPATPAGATPATSRRPSTSITQPLSRHPSVSQPRSRLGSESGVRRPSLLSHGGLSDSLSMSSIETEVVPEDAVATLNTTPSASLNEQGSLADRRLSGAHGLSLRNLRSMSSTMDQSASNSALEDEDEEEEDQSATPSQMTPTIGGVHPAHATEAAKALGRRLSDAVISTPMDVRGPILETPVTNGVESSRVGMSNSSLDGKAPEHPTTHLSTPADLAAALYENPKLAALRGSSNTNTTFSSKSFTSPLQSPISPPILINPKCSGYFVEPMKWMEPFLQDGHLSGKIVCPNKKCGAKLGNYDWAGVCCGCKEWVTPGFCINRSKVDEIV